MVKKVFLLFGSTPIFNRLIQLSKLFEHVELKKRFQKEKKGTPLKKSTVSMLCPKSKSIL